MGPPNTPLCLSDGFYWDGEPVFPDLPSDGVYSNMDAPVTQRSKFCANSVLKNVKEHAITRPLALGKAGSQALVPQLMPKPALIGPPWAQVHLSPDQSPSERWARQPSQPWLRPPSLHPPPLESSPTLPAPSPTLDHPRLSHLKCSPSPKWVSCFYPAVSSFLQGWGLNPGCFWVKACFCHTAPAEQ